VYHWVKNNPVGNDTWIEYAERFYKNFGVKYNNLNRLYKHVNKLENVDLKLKELHSRGITDCLFLNREFFDSAKELHPFARVNKNLDWESLCSALSFKTKVYLNDDCEQIKKWFHKDPTSTPVASKLAWSTDELDYLRERTIHYQYFKEEQGIMKRNTLVYADQIYLDYNNHYGGRSFHAIKKIINSKTFFTKTSKIQSPLKEDDEEKYRKFTEELWIYNKNPKIISPFVKKVLDYAKTIDLEKEFGRAKGKNDEALDDPMQEILEEEGIEEDDEALEDSMQETLEEYELDIEEIDKKKKNSKKENPFASRNLMIKFADKLLRKEENFTGTLMRFYYQYNSPLKTLLTVIDSEASEMMKKLEGVNDVKTEPENIKKLVDIFGLKKKKTFDLFQIDLNTNSSNLKGYNFFKVNGDTMTEFPKEEMIKIRDDTIVDGVTGELFKRNEVKACEHPHVSKNDNSGPFAGFVTPKSNLLLQNYSGTTKEELLKEKSVNDQYRETPILNSKIITIDGNELTVTEDYLVGVIEFIRINGVIRLRSIEGGWRIACFKCIILELGIVDGCPDHDYTAMEENFPEEVKETKLANICNKFYEFFRFCRAILGFPEILSEYGLTKDDVKTCQTLILFEWLRTKKELIEFDVKYKSQKFFRIILDPFDEETQKKMIRLTLRNSLCSPDNLRYPDTAKLDEQCLQFRLNALNQPTGIYMVPLKK
jgi:hypothetical protein